MYSLLIVAVIVTVTLAFYMVATLMNGGMP